MSAAPVWLPLERLTFDRRLQLRGPLFDETHVARLCDAHEAGRPFDPIEAVEERRGKRTTYWVFSGFNRGEMYKRRGVASVEVVVSPGTFVDAEFRALSANSGHGLNRTPEDCRRAFDRLLDDPVLLARAFAEARNGTVRAIAGACGLSTSSVAAYLGDRGLRADRLTGTLVPADRPAKGVRANGLPAGDEPDAEPDHLDVVALIQRDIRAAARRAFHLPDTPAAGRARTLLTAAAEAIEDVAAELLQPADSSAG